MEMSYMEIKDVKTGSVKFQVNDEAKTPDYNSSQIHDFELLSKSLSLASEPQPPSVEYFEPSIINATIIVEEKPDLENVDKEDAAESFNSWAQLASKVEENLERDFLEENVNLEIESILESLSQIEQNINTLDVEYAEASSLYTSTNPILMGIVERKKILTFFKTEKQVFATKS